VTGELEGYECLQASRHPLYDVSGTERERKRERERERERSDLAACQTWLGSHGTEQSSVKQPWKSLSAC